MLFISTQEIRETVNISTNQVFANLSPDLARVEEQVIKKYLGTDTYEALLADYTANSSNLSGMQDKWYDLLIKCRPVIAGIALFKYSNIQGVQVSDAGYQMLSSDTHKQAFQWMKNEARSYLVQIGYTALDDLLKFLEDNKATYTEWASSDAYILDKSFIVNTAAAFSEVINIGESRLTFMAIKPIMKKVEDFTIKNALGKTVYDDIKEKIANPELTQTWEPIMTELQAATVLFTMARALYELPLDLFDGGILLNFYKTFSRTDTGITITAGTEAERKKLAETFKSDAETYLLNVITYLNENASDTVFPLWYESSKYVAPGSGSGEIRKATDKIFGFY